MTGDEITFEPGKEGYVLTKKLDHNRFERWMGVAGTDQTVEERMDALRGCRE